MRAFAFPLALAGLVAVSPAIAAGDATDRDRCAATRPFANPAAIAALRAGVNLPNWDEDGTATIPRSRTLTTLREWGMSHIRLPIDDERFGGEHEGAERYLAALSEEIAELQKLGFSVSVDLHPGARLADLYDRDPEAALRAVMALWTDLAPIVGRFAASQTFAELLNEPPTSFEVWRDQLPRLARHVRTLLPHHTIVAAPFGPQRHEALDAMMPLDDANVVYAIHYYDPFAFTHQSADWVDAKTLGVLAGLPYPSPEGDPAMARILRDLDARGESAARIVLSNSLLDGWTEASVDRAFDAMAAWSHRTGAPVIVNEFGVYSGGAPRAARLAWLSTVAKAAASRCMGWTHWDFEDGFGLADKSTGRLDAGVLDALSGGLAEPRSAGSRQRPDGSIGRMN